MADCVNCMYTINWSGIFDGFCEKMKRVILWGDAECPSYYNLEQFTKDTYQKDVGVEIPISKEERDLFRKERGLNRCRR